MGCALFCALLVLLWAGNLLTLFYAGVMGLGLAALALRGTPDVLQWSSLFIAVQLGLASFSRADYLFTAVAQTSAGPMPSDVAQIETALWLPYWVWGAGLAALSGILLSLSTWWFLRSWVQARGPDAHADSRSSPTGFWKMSVSAHIDGSAHKRECDPCRFHQQRSNARWCHPQRIALRTCASTAAIAVKLTMRRTVAEALSTCALYDGPIRIGPRPTPSVMLRTKL